MEAEGATFLSTLAGLMITFAGLAALFLVLRQAAEGRLPRLDRYPAKTVMTYTFVDIIMQQPMDAPERPSP